MNYVYLLILLALLQYFFSLQKQAPLAVNMASKRPKRPEMKFLSVPSACSKILWSS